MRTGIVLLSASLFLMSSCNLFKKSDAPEEATIDLVDEAEATEEEELPEEYYKTYQASRKRVHDLLHTKLEVAFNYEKQHLLGKATLHVKPYFHPVNYLDLDAQGFDIATIQLVGDSTNTVLDYTYEDNVLHITLDKTYTRNDTFTVFIDYTAKPNDLNNKGSLAINEAKGLYFINPTGEDGTKPRQIWTQGETQASSCWFPTIDAPNEKMTQEIYMTVDSADISLSNGELIYSNFNYDGTRTDYWKQDQPHAPYLTMMAVGEFAKIEDFWRDSIAVDYYVEKAYEPYAQMVFGNTPEMIEFYSKKLGVDYPWDKYAQIVVRDFVSGAMENTGAVIHFDALQHDARAHLDETYEDIIAHELFHHWFGDLVTCESWSNLPLNESFATYGEYLWLEYKYGREEADQHLDNDLRTYLIQASNNKEKLIRYYYEDKEAMFDAHSYQKGGRVLHMLRKYVGDEAFFASLNLYLENNRYQTVEIHDLRKAFEEVTGEDLNWFFNQWFLKAGHPVLEVSYWHDEISGNVYLSVDQTQDINASALYKLPVKVAIHGADGVKEYTIEITDKSQEFSFLHGPEAPQLVDFDVERMLLCEKSETKSLAEWIYQFEHTSLYMSKLEALNGIAATMPDTAANPAVVSVIKKALKDPYWGIREEACYGVEELYVSDRDQFKETLKTLSLQDSKSSVRATALGLLEMYKDDDMVTIYRAAANDSSYLVLGTALNALGEHDPKTAVVIAEQNMQSTDGSLQMSVATVLAKYGKKDYADFFKKGILNSGIYKYSIAVTFSEYLKNANDPNTVKALAVLKELSGNNSDFIMKFIYSNLSNTVVEKYQAKADELSAKMNALEEGSTERSSLQQEIDAAQQMIDLAEQAISSE